MPHSLIIEFSKFSNFFIVFFILLGITACDDTSPSDEVDTQQEQSTETENGDTGTGTEADSETGSETGSETATDLDEDSTTGSASGYATFSCGNTINCNVSSEYCEEAFGGVDDGSGPSYSCHALPLVCRDNSTCQCLEDNIVNGAISCAGDGETGLTSLIAYP